MKGFFGVVLSFLASLILLVVLVGLGAIVVTNIGYVNLGRNIAELKSLMYDDGWGGFYAGDGVLLCQTEYACIHETGHWLDEKLGYPSETIEFKETLDTFINVCIENGDEWGNVDYYCNLARFPGVNGNAVDNWGGYGEAYAEMYKYLVHEDRPLPVVFVEFYFNPE